jgi:general secretion pathway protein D
MPRVKRFSKHRAGLLSLTLGGFLVSGTLLAQDLDADVSAAEDPAVVDALATPAPPVPAVPQTIDPAPVAAPAVPPGQPESTVRLTFPNTSVNEILQLYEVLTNKRLIRDSGLAQGAPLTIVVPGEVPRSEAIRLIEASLLLNGYSIIPVDERTLKVLGPAKFPRAEGIPIYSSPFLLPESDQVVSYFMKLNYLAPEQAVQLFTTFISPPKAYTSFTPVPNVQAVLITENVRIIRQLLNLQAMVDVPPAQVMTEFVSLKRADAEKVVEVLQGLLDRRDEAASRAAGQPPQQAQVDDQGQVIQASLGVPGGAQFESNLVIGETQLVADPRTNRILVVTRPVNFPYIKKLINELDAPMPLDAVLERPLQFISANDVLPVLSDLLADGEQVAGGGGTRSGGQGRSVLEGGVGTGQGIGTDGGLSTGGGLSRPDRIREPTEDGAPESIIVGKTKIIADKSSNSIIVIGPPDSRQKVAQLLDMLDVRPRQVYIAAVIGELNLTDEMQFGFSYFLRYLNNGEGTGLAGSIINPLNIDPANALSGENLPSPTDLLTPQVFRNLQGLTVYGTIADAVDIYARALESTGKFKVLSRPVVYTSNNKKAVISSGQQVPFVSSTLASTTITTQNTTGITSNITFKDVLLKLEVLPLINANRDVTLVIVQTKNDVLRFENLGGNQTPVIGSQELTTTVTVPNGGTVVLGGLIVERMETADAGVPFLMRVPVLGYLFKQTSRKVTRQELLVLLQPTVVENDAELAEASWQERYRSKVGDESYAQAAPPAFANTPVIFDGQELQPDSEIRRPRDPLRPAGWDYQEYAPEPTQRGRRERRPAP